MRTRERRSTTFDLRCWHIFDAEAASKYLHRVCLSLHGALGSGGGAMLQETRVISRLIHAAYGNKWDCLPLLPFRKLPKCYARSQCAALFQIRSLRICSSISRMTLSQTQVALRRMR